MSPGWTQAANATPSAADTPDMSTATAARRRPKRGRWILETAAHAGSLVTLAALLVLAGAAGGLADGVPAPGPATTVTFDGGR